MSLPMATTTISILANSVPSDDIEPTYEGNTPTTRQTVATNVRATISLPRGIESLTQAEQTKLYYMLDCDEFNGELSHLNAVRDENTNIVYEIQWAHWYSGLGIDHWQASIYRSEGLA